MNREEEEVVVVEVGTEIERGTIAELAVVVDHLLFHQKVLQIGEEMVMVTNESRTKKRVKEEEVVEVTE